MLLSWRVKLHSRCNHLSLIQPCMRGDWSHWSKVAAPGSKLNAGSESEVVCMLVCNVSSNSSASYDHGKWWKIIAHTLTNLLLYPFFCSVGCIFCCPKEPIKACTRFRARVLIFNIEIPVTKGFPVSLALSLFLKCSWEFQCFRAYMTLCGCHCVIVHFPFNFWTCAIE